MGVIKGTFLKIPQKKNKKMSGCSCWFHRSVGQQKGLWTFLGNVPIPIYLQYPIPRCLLFASHESTIQNTKLLHTEISTNSLQVVGRTKSLRWKKRSRSCVLDSLENWIAAFTWCFHGARLMKSAGQCCVLYVGIPTCLNLNPCHCCWEQGSVRM